MSIYIGHYLILICIFTCIASQNSKTSEGQIADTITNGKDSSSTTENDNSSRIDKKNDENQPTKHLLQSSGSTVTTKNNSAATIAPSVTVFQEEKSTSVNTNKDNKFIGNRNIGTGAVIRGFYVFVGLGAIVVMYIVVRTIRLKRKKTTVRKYGVLTNREDVEMTPLGAEDEEEESTLFDMTKSRP
ncbi:hypothetical protein L9F63_007250 [Diploptera punctata]|uniref:Uncharacterized protein n=1 Tax=Diploptera punctata TaxID=6984 RepID=A0AAD7Z883_DIPPU|nr:hypothetical protein L9F63_007250 [Diploptera punctata]